MTPLLQKYRPELLHEYLLGSGQFFPPGHPRQVFTGPVNQKISGTSGNTGGEACIETHAKKREVVQACQRNLGPERNKETLSRMKKPGSKSRTLVCPQCAASYSENKMSRLRAHIKKHHSQQAKKLLRKVDCQYPPWKPKTTTGNTCTICSRFIRGTVTHLQRHHSSKHWSRLLFFLRFCAAGLLLQLYRYLYVKLLLPS